MNMSKILVLMHEDLVPPDSMKGFSDKEIVEWKTEYDVVSTLKEMGHEVQPVGVFDDVQSVNLNRILHLTYSRNFMVIPCMTIMWQVILSC